METHTPPKCRLDLNALHGVISSKTEFCNSCLCSFCFVILAFEKKAIIDLTETVGLQAVVEFQTQLSLSVHV
jgi:hypothetical protein